MSMAEDPLLLDLDEDESLLPMAPGTTTVGSMGVNKNKSASVISDSCVRRRLNSRDISNNESLIFQDPQRKQWSLLEMEPNSTVDKRPLSKILNRGYDDDKPSLGVLISTHLAYILLVFLANIYDFFGKVFCPADYKDLSDRDGYAPLLSDFESLYTRRLYRRISDCWNRSITGVPGRTLNMLERYSNDGNISFKYTGKAVELLNLSSYNYLGFAESHGLCADAAIEAIKGNGVGITSSRAEAGTTAQHEELEELVAEFVGKEESMIFNMGFATNALMIPAFAGPGCLIISDKLNHSSLVFGCRLSGASIQTYSHNNVKDLEKVLRKAIASGQPRNHREWKKIIVIVEGLYSMEGTIINLPGLVKLKEKYKFYLFIDEAHSIGALGKDGRGVCDFWGVDPAKVDILMGTFTKSFGAAGGYIAGSKDLIQHFKQQGLGYIYAEPMPPAVCQQVLTSMRIIMGREGGGEGRKRLNQILENSVYFMRELRRMGFIVYGDEGSPVVPVLLFQPGKIKTFSIQALARGLAVVVVGFPATPIESARVRFCISASHTKEDLEHALKEIGEIGDVLQLKHRMPNWLRWTWIF